MTEPAPPSDDAPTPEQLARLADGDDIPVDDHPDQTPCPVEPT